MEINEDHPNQNKKGACLELIQSLLQQGSQRLKGKQRRKLYSGKRKPSGPSVGTGKLEAGYVERGHPWLLAGGLAYFAFTIGPRLAGAKIKYTVSY